MSTFNENSLYGAIIVRWGENGAHAEVYRDICKKAGIELVAPDLSPEALARKIYEETGHNKIQTIKRLRYECEDQGLGFLSLKQAKDLVDRAISGGQ